MFWWAGPIPWQQSVLECNSPERYWQHNEWSTDVAAKTALTDFMKDIDRVEQLLKQFSSFGSSPVKKRNCLAMRRIVDYR